MRIGIVTGTRAEYGIWKPVIRACATHENLDIKLIVTGVHLLPAFGETWRRIEADGFEIAAKVPMYGADEPPYASLARGIAGLGDAFTRLKLDLALVLGDRLEVLAAAGAALAAQVPIGHLHGGESASGQLDEHIRHAVSKMAAVHFVATAGAQARLRAMGEPPKRIHRVGAPALDEALRHYELCRRTVEGAVGPPLLVLHPTSSRQELEYGRTKRVLTCLRAAGYAETVAIGPNNDPGHEGILRAYKERRAGISLRMSVSQEDFWTSLWQSPFMIGNSSSGIIEAATFRRAAINVGDRQAGREQSGNVINVPFAVDAIRLAMHTVLSDATFREHVATCKNIYGDGRACGRIAGILAKLDVARLAGPKLFHNSDNSTGVSGPLSASR